MSSGLIILIGFGISAVLMLTVWLASKNTREKNRNQSDIEKQKADIISTIEKAVNGDRKGTEHLQQAQVNGGMPAWGKWFMALACVPMLGSFILAGTQGQGRHDSAAIQTTTTTNMYITRVDIGTNTSMPQDTTTTQPIATITSYDVGSWPNDICFDGTNIWVTNSGSNVVTKLRPNDGAILGSYILGMNPTTSVCFDGTNIWVTSSQSNNITKLRPNDGAILGIYPAGQNPMGCCFDGTSIWVVNGNNNSVTKIRASDGVTLGTFTAINAQDQICFDGVNIWVTDSRSNCVTKLRASDGTILGTYAVGPIPVDICYDGTNIWVTNYGSNTVTKLNASDSSILGTYVVGNYPDGICFDGTNIWVDVDDNINTVTKLNATDGSILGTYAVGDDPKGICYDGIYIWVANMGGDNVSKLLVTK